MGSRQAWRAKEIEKIDEALTLYRMERDDLNKDGRSAERAKIVDDMLERRYEQARILAEDAS